MLIFTVCKTRRKKKGHAQHQTQWKSIAFRKEIIIKPWVLSTFPKMTAQFQWKNSQYSEIWNLFFWSKISKYIMLQWSNGSVLFIAIWGHQKITICPENSDVSEFERSLQVLQHQGHSSSSPFTTSTLALISEDSLTSNISSLKKKSNLLQSKSSIADDTVAFDLWWDCLFSCCSWKWYILRASSVEISWTGL